ncbi:MAG: hypothetical protein JXM69_11400 [Anaerolineae bacterium]|nr:hypothetical protein [Anaerolineae bacterium]
MIHTQVTVVKKETIAPAWWRLTIAAPDLSPRLSPGQFLFLSCADRFTCYLRRPIFPAPIDDEHLTLLLHPNPDPGLAWLLTRTPGDRLDVIGPLGTGFPLPDSIRNLLLVSDSRAIDPLLGQLSRAVEAGVAVTLALGGSRASALYPVSALPPVVEYQAATLDGSLGHRGLVTDLLPNLLSWADAVAAVGSTGLYRALQAHAAQVRFRAEANYLYGLCLPYPLACGVGACHSCAVETKTGLRLACVDGPVFDLTLLEFADHD